MDILGDKELTHTNNFILTQVVSMLLGYVLFISVAKSFAGNNVLR